MSIATLEMIIGDAPKAALTEAVAWASGRRADLLKTWHELNP